MTGQIEGNQNKGTTPPPAANGVGVQSQAWETAARFVEYQEPKPWKVEGREGITYRITLKISEGTVFVKVPEELYKDMLAAHLEFGDKIVLYWGKASVKGELRVDPISWKKV